MRIALFTAFFITLLVCRAGTADVHPLPLTKRINVDFSNESRLVIIKNVADLYGLNIVIPDNFPDAKISMMKLKDTTWSEIFYITLAESGYMFVQGPSTVWIVPRESDQKAIMLLHEKLEQEITESGSYRQALARLITIKDPKELEQARAKIGKILDDGNSSGEDVLAVFSKGAANPAPEPTAPSGRGSS